MLAKRPDAGFSIASMSGLCYKQLAKQGQRLSRSLPAMNNISTQPDQLDPSSTAYTQRLLSLIESRHRLVTDLLTLTASQGQVSFTEEMPAILGLLARKEGLVDELQQLQSELSVYAYDEPEDRVWDSVQQRTRCQQLADTTEQLLKKILELDSATLDSMHQHRDAIAAQLQHGQDSTLAESAYTAGSQLAESLLDIPDL
jgi:hypothetical protein